MIRSVHGKNSPTHLLFVHLNNDYSIDRIWRFDWTYLDKKKRLREKKVRGVMIGWQFTVKDVRDKNYLILDNRDKNTSVGSRPKSAEMSTTC